MKMVHREVDYVGCEDGRCMELPQDRVQWWGLVSAAVNLRRQTAVPYLYYICAS